MTDWVNEHRADLGQGAVRYATTAGGTGAWHTEPRETCVIDTLAYIAHYLDRLGVDPADAFRRGLDSYTGDHEDGPPAATYPGMADTIGGTV